MMKKLLFLMAVVAIFGGCKRNEGSLTPDERDEEKWVWRFVSLPTDTSVMILDSMLNKLYVDACPASRARHEWEWAREARRALGLSSEVIDLGHLDEVSERLDEYYAPMTAYSQVDMNEAAGVFACTAKFRMLNAYQTLDSLMEDSFDSKDLFTDYLLWESVNQEYEDYYTDGGSSAPMMLSSAHKTFCELRCTILKEEIGYLDVEHEGAAEWYVEAYEIRWKPEQKAIRLWYDHRMKMADRLGDLSRAEYLRRMTYKTVFIYHHLQLGWGYDFEHL